MPPRLRSSFSSSRGTISAFLLAHALERAVLAVTASMSLRRLIEVLTVLKLVSMPPSQRWSTIGHAGAGRFLGDDLARLALGADEEHGAARWTASLRMNLSASCEHG
jgi:hypothetical protein